jgi:Glycosyl hydrolase family 20, domain 2/Glycosyl hydrolase family 20, catalytic domain
VIVTGHRLLIPVRSMKFGDGRFVWPDQPVLATACTDDVLPLNNLVSTLRRECTVGARVVMNAAGPADVRIRRDRRVSHSEGYRMRVDATGIEILAGTSAGAFYGLATLGELVRAHGLTIPCCEIRDRPDFSRRGVYLDCSRGKVPTVDTLKGLVEFLASLKVNELQLYVENVFTFSRHPAIGRGFSPFTPEDLLAVQDHCRLHHVRFVPSLASFGHMERVLTLPEYSSLGEKPGHFGLPGGTTLCPGDPGSIRLVADLLDEFLPLFTASDFNACCDETWELGQGRSRRRAGRLGGGEVYLRFLRKLHRLAEKHGKRMNVWADIVLNHPETIRALPPDIILLNWDYAPDGSRIPRTRELTEAGRAVVVCPGTSSWQTHGTRLGNALDNVRVFAREGRRRRAVGLLNTDWGDYGHRNPLGVSMHGFAHGAAHSWNGRAVDAETFTETFCFHALGQRDDRLAGHMRAIGRTDETIGASLYHAISEGLRPERDPFRGIPLISPVRVYDSYRRRPMETARAEGCRAVIDELDDVRSWRALAKGRTRFARSAIEDLVLAADMDVLACHWILTGQALRSGKHVAARNLRRLASRIRRTAASFQRGWMRDHRSSRLDDNLTLFRSAATECEAIAGRTGRP